MTPIWAHEYIVSSRDSDKIGVNQVIINIISDKKQPENLEVIDAVIKFFDNGLNIAHRIVLRGYKK